MGALPEGDLRLGFRPYVWLGDEKRGISWFAESDAGFHVADPGGVTEILRREDQVILRINHVSTPVKLVPGAGSGGEAYPAAAATLSATGIAWSRFTTSEGVELETLPYCFH